MFFPPELSALAGPKPRFTRSFGFTRVNPSTAEYLHLIDTCESIDACLGYKTVRDGWKIRLVGFILLRGNRAMPNAIARLLPNFHVFPFSNAQADDGFQWIDRIQTGSGPFFVDGPVFSNHKEHPFLAVKRRLFFND
jgi:hypothetical protein